MTSPPIRVRLLSVIMDALSSMSIADVTEAESLMKDGVAASRWGLWIREGDGPLCCSLEDRRGAGDGENVAMVIDDCTRKPQTRSSAQTYFLFWIKLLMPVTNRHVIFLLLHDLLLVRYDNIYFVWILKNPLWFIYPNLPCTIIINDLSNGILNCSLFILRQHGNITFARCSVNRTFSGSLNMVAPSLLFVRLKIFLVRHCVKSLSPIAVSELRSSLFIRLYEISELCDPFGTIPFPRQTFSTFPRVIILRYSPVL